MKGNALLNDAVLQGHLFDTHPEHVCASHTLSLHRYCLACLQFRDCVLLISRESGAQDNMPVQSIYQSDLSSSGLGPSNRPSDDQHLAFVELIRLSLVGLVSLVQILRGDCDRISSFALWTGLAAENQSQPDTENNQQGYRVLLSFHFAPFTC